MIVTFNGRQVQVLDFEWNRYSSDDSFISRAEYLDTEVELDSDEIMELDAENRELVDEGWFEYIVGESDYLQD